MGAKKFEVVNPGHLTPEMQKGLEEAKRICGADKVFVMESDDSGVRVVVRSPDRAIYRKFRSERADPARKSGAFEGLFLACLQYPSPADFEKTLDELPALADTFGMALWNDVMGAEDATVKKA